MVETFLILFSSLSGTSSTEVFGLLINERSPLAVYGFSLTVEFTTGRTIGLLLAVVSRKIWFVSGW
jgi:hypothetical protein